MIPTLFPYTTLFRSPIYGAKKGGRTDGLISRRFSVRYYGCRDVYKRQVLFFPTMKTLDPKKAENKAEKAAVNGSAAVSYTHLDVYKIQILFRRARGKKQDCKAKTVFQLRQDTAQSSAF